MGDLHDAVKSNNYDLVDELLSDDEDDNVDDFRYDLELLGVRFLIDRKPEYTSNYGVTYVLNDLFEKYGYVVEYEGSNNSIEGQTGMYFVI